MLVPCPQVLRKRAKPAPLLPGVLCKLGSWFLNPPLSHLGRVMPRLSSFGVSLINMLSLFVLGSGTPSHLSTLSMIYVASQASVLCVFTAHSVNGIPISWNSEGVVGTVSVFTLQLLHVYFSEMSTHQQRMM